MTTTTHAAAAREIRKELKNRGLKGSVKSRSYAGGSAVDVKVETVTTLEKLYDLRVFCEQYQRGDFDAMTDSYSNSNVREDLPQVKYVFVSGATL